MILRRLTLRGRALAAAGLIACGAIGSAEAGPFVQLPYEQFGHLRNNGPRCAATATMNSFIYLKNAFPQLYGGTDLTGGTGADRNGDGTVDERDARDELSDGYTAPDGTQRNGMRNCPRDDDAGASAKDFWEAKLYWFDDFAPGTTIFHGMIDEDFSTWYGNRALTRGVPTWEFLFEMLRQEEDVEIGIDIPGLGGHAVTLTSLHMQDDKNGNGRLDVGDLAAIDYIDPNRPEGHIPGQPGPTLAGIYLHADGSLHFPWADGGDRNRDGQPDNPIDSSIFLAYAESPALPEPGSLVLVLSAGSIAALLQRRRSQTGVSPGAGCAG